MKYTACLALLASALSTARAVTVYGQIPLGHTGTGTAGAPQKTLAAYDTTELVPPALPSPMPAVAYTMDLQSDANAVTGLSIPHVGGGLWGFSIEMSVLSQVLGKNSSFLQVPLLNLLANIQERAGGVVIRIGGNTQEFAAMVDDIPDGHTFAKTEIFSNQTTKTPSVIYTRDMFYMTSNMSALVNVKWFFGIPFNQTNPWRLTIAEEAQRILGDNLLALQAANEPDFYQRFQHRVTYSPQQYCDEVQDLLNTIDANPNIPAKNMLLGPSIATGDWTPEQVWDAGFIDKFKSRLYALTVERYPNNNCAAQFATDGPIINPQDIFPAYLNHQAPISFINIYANTQNLAQQANLPLIMFETNTASCGGFAGISDSYGAALWAVDYGFQLANMNFTHGMFHVGGQNAFYNPFTAPPGNQSSYSEWSVGSIYYAAIVLAEALGKTNTSQVIDLWGNSGSIYTPSYAIYEKGRLNKVALFNYMDDATGASDLQVTLHVPTGAPGAVKVKYLEAKSVSSRQNITWAGQTFGNHFEVDGRFKGDLNVTTVNCDTTANTCVIPVRAPQFALVFFDTTTEQISVGQATQTFSTTLHTKLKNTLSPLDATALAQSNGHQAIANLLGGTSDGKRKGVSVSAAGRAVVISGVAAAVSMFVGGLWVVRALR